MDQGSNKNHSPAYNFTPTVTKFCVMWEGLSLPHDTKFGNCRCKIVDSRSFHNWSLIHGLRWSGLIKVGPGPWFNIMVTSYQYRKSHCGDKMIFWLSYLHNGISHTGKITIFILKRVPDNVIQNGRWNLHKSRGSLSVIPLRAKFVRGSKKIYLHFMLFLHIGMTLVIEILLQVRWWPTYST